MHDIQTLMWPRIGYCPSSRLGDTKVANIQYRYIGAVNCLPGHAAKVGRWRRREEERAGGGAGTRSRSRSRRGKEEQEHGGKREGEGGGKASLSK